MTELNQDELEIGKWYVGESRFTGDIALWNGMVFIGLTYSMGDFGESRANYGIKGFSPIKELLNEKDL
jgi:hypothetical protein